MQTTDDKELDKEIEKKLSGSPYKYLRKLLLEKPKEKTEESKGAKNN